MVSTTWAPPAPLVAHPPPSRPSGDVPSATPPAIDVAAAQRYMEGHDHATRAAVLDVMASSPTFRLVAGESKEVERQRTAARWSELAAAGVFVNTITSTDPVAGRGKLDAVHETASLLDYSLCIGMSVHFSLFGGSIAALGTPAQAAAWLPGVEALTMRGCFALTELGHGSNARGVETEARFDAAADAFVLHTPSDGAQKYWIGGAAFTARWAVAFAQLYLPGEADSRGVHAFVVRIRADDGAPVPGVRLADCGYKVGLNGVDNGRIWFTAVPVPRAQLLARYARVDAAGVYSCDAPSPDALFGVTMGALSGGRIGIAASGVGQARVALAIAVRYGLRRRAFAAAPGAPETLLLDYPMHRRRLLPRLATTVVHQGCLNDLKARWGGRLSAKDGHVASCGYKALMTWHALDTMQVAREACGGQGYKSENRIAVSRAALDISATFEGDNTVLLQQVAKACLATYARGVKAGGRFGGALTHLNRAPPPPPPSAPSPLRCTRCGGRKRASSPAWRRPSPPRLPPPVPPPLTPLPPTRSPPTRWPASTPSSCCSLRLRRRSRRRPRRRGRSLRRSAPSTRSPSSTTMRCCCAPARSRRRMRPPSTAPWTVCARRCGRGRRSWPTS